MSEFNVGDKVRATRYAATGTVISLNPPNGDDVMVKMHNGAFADYSLSFKNTSLTLIERKVTVKPTKAQVDAAVDRLDKAIENHETWVKPYSAIGCLYYILEDLGIEFEVTK